jgi:hypothetical protein
MKRFVFSCVLTLCLLGSCASPRDSGGGRILAYQWDGDEETVVLENEALSLAFIPKTAEIALTHKTSGAVWRSSPENAREDAAADALTKQLLLSQFSIPYADAAGVGMTLSSFHYSVENGRYEYGLVNGGLEVNYTVGSQERIYYLPPAAPEERMGVFMKNMSPQDLSKVKSSYRLYDINGLRSSDNRDSLLAAYPDLAEGPVYVLRENAQEYMKAQIEEIFAAAGYTAEDYEEDIGHYHVLRENEKPLFNLTIRYELEGNSLLVSIPFDRIAYRASYPITQISLLPFLGAGGLEDEGYLLVPDGSGALIRFNNGRQDQIAYTNAVYGWDEAMTRDAVISDSRAPYPVYGIQKNSAALLCVIEEGASYAEIRADVSGRNCSYNSVFAGFTLIHGATMDISARSDKAVYRYEARLPEGERIAARFTPCGLDGYVGMAKEYRAYLERNYPELGKRHRTGGVPLAVEILGAVSKTRHRLGIPFELPIRLTSYSEMESMIRDFAARGWKDVRVKLLGWFNGGVDHTAPSRLRLIPELGGGFNRLVSAAEDADYRLYAEADFLYVREPGLFDRFNSSRDAARSINRKRVELYPYSFVWFGRSQWGKMSYLARPSYMAGQAEAFRKKAEKLGLRNLAFRTIGSVLAGDYNDKRHISREAAMNLQRTLLLKMKEESAGVLVNTGYAYTLPYADIITDMALTDQGFGITDVSVPFYPIALHGLVPFTGRAINLAGDYTKNILKTIESGGGLYFSFMTGESALLQETRYRQFYANEYGKWAEDAGALYQRFVRDFGDTYSQKIENHDILSPDVTVTEYGNGTRVVVNASRTDFSYQGRLIPADSYAVIR